MKKNVASQDVGAEMITAADGTDFSGTVTVYVCGDAGTQAIGSVGSGVCTSEGHGYYTYAPAQAETNYDVVAFTFTGSGAISATREIYTTFPQTGDNYARIGAPIGASISADIAGVQSDTNDLQTRTPAALVSGRMDSSVGAMAANTLTASALATDAVTEIVTALLTTQMTESYAADGTAPTVAQALHMLISSIFEVAVTSTTMTCKKLDGSTSAMTFSLNSATDPTSRTRAT